MKKLNITITGDLGSGKSCIAKELCHQLNYNYFSTGSIQREIGKKSGMDTLELNYFAEQNDEIDKYIDNLVINLNDEIDTYVLDSRMAWHFIKKSFKIYLTVNPVVAARRVISDNTRNSEPVFKNITEKSLNLLERRTAEDKRFKEKYNVDCNDLNNYDLVIDTTIPTVPEISKLILKLYKEFSDNHDITKYWVSPLILYPTEHIRKLEREEAKKIQQSVKENGYEFSQNIQTIKLGTALFIWDGHIRVSASILNKLPLVPIVVLAKDNEEMQSGISVSHFVESAYKPSLLYDWEEFHGFRFESYPEITKKVDGRSSGYNC